MQDEPPLSDDELRDALEIAEQQLIAAEKAERALRAQHDAAWAHARECHDAMALLLKETRQRMGAPSRAVVRRVLMPGETQIHKHISVWVDGRKPGRKRLIEVFHRLCGTRHAQNVPGLSGS